MARNQFRVDFGYREMEFPSSYLFPKESTGGFKFNSHRRSYRDPYVSDVVDTLSDQFSSLSLLRPKPRLIPPLPSILLLQHLRPQSLSSANNINNGGPKADQKLYGGSSKLSYGTNDPIYERYLSRIRQNELQKERAKVLQRQEARLHKRGLVHKNGNVLKESVGTGVFHPLQRPIPKTVVTSVKKHNERKQNQSEKKVMSKERRGVMQQQQEECHYHLPLDLDFSKDWTF